MKLDTFWEKFWLSFFGVAVLAIFGSSFLFITHINSLNAAAVGVSFDPSQDPFESSLRRNNLSLTDGYAYRDALPLGMSQWAWDTQLDWRSTAQVYEGSGALRMTFGKQWAGMGMNGFSVSRSSKNSLLLAVYPDESVGDLYIELYDSSGNSMVRQSLGWYAPDATLVPNKWQYLSIPLQNLINNQTKTITGISISTKNAGTAYVDAMQFSSAVVTHGSWIQPAYVDLPPYNPFATSTPDSLPYAAGFTANDFSRWFSYYGLFKQADSGFILGPAITSNEAVAVYRGGRFWSDYQVKGVVDWGSASTFSVLVRVTGPGDFVSCVLTYYGQTAQIYRVKGGVSTQLAQTPGLPVPAFSPWENVSVGARVQGNRVSCMVNGTWVLSADIPDLQLTGSVGIEAWDENPYSSPHTLKSLEVRPMLGE